MFKIILVMIINLGFCGEVHAISSDNFIRDTSIKSCSNGITTDSSGNFNGCAAAVVGETNTFTSSKTFTSPILASSTFTIGVSTYAGSVQLADYSRVIMGGCSLIFSTWAVNAGTISVTGLNLVYEHYWDFQLNENTGSNSDYLVFRWGNNGKNQVDSHGQVQASGVANNDSSTATGALVPGAATRGGTDISGQLHFRLNSDKSNMDFWGKGTCRTSTPTPERWDVSGAVTQSASTLTSAQITNILQPANAAALNGWANLYVCIPFANWP